MDAYHRGARAVLRAAFGQEKVAYSPFTLLGSLTRSAALHPWDRFAGSVGAGEYYDAMQARRDAWMRDVLNLEARRAALEDWWRWKTQADMVDSVPQTEALPPRTTSRTESDERPAPEEKQPSPPPQP